MASPSKHTIIEASRLTKRFGDLTAVHELSFSIARGEVFGFLGPNGAGKTTTMHMLCGISPPTEGRVLINDQQTRNHAEIRLQFGICPQENVLWPKLTCLEQMVFVAGIYGMDRKVARKRSLELLDFLGLAEKSAVLSRKLSGGMKRRLNICLALVHDPPILLLDEPEAGLDPQSRILVRDYIRSLAGSKTIILTTHNMDEADRLSDRVAIMDHGALLMLDSPASLKKTVGDGDVLEVRTDEPLTGREDELRRQLSQVAEHVNIQGSTITVRAKNLLGSMPAITASVSRAGCRITEMTMRENTLEDVFIHLTGRKLRQ
jgi:ABC-2 type transport system ATP-binding protein